MTRRWFDDEKYKEELEERIKGGQFFVAYSNGRYEVPGQVIRVIYAGYRVKIPSNEEVTINLTNDRTVREITTIEYESLGKQFFVEKEKEAELKKQKEVEAQQRLDFQNLCLHETTNQIQVVKVAGCDIFDTVCVNCEKILRRSWSTAYENDPDDLVSDWNWFVKECKKLYGDYVPKKEDYGVVSEIEPMYGYYSR